MAESVQIKWEREMDHSGAAFLTAYSYRRRDYESESRVWDAEESCRWLHVPCRLGTVKTMVMTLRRAPVTLSGAFVPGVFTIVTGHSIQQEKPKAVTRLGDCGLLAGCCGDIQ